ncbi:glycosyltransferase family 2 protein [Ottowia caeni]|uniref:glycosyltransferase family 2 protein n=1 Tax=Ottowia caeni TaxID=2870339 RepID=UPI003D752104|nr:glycosyltransferase family 2 protein [Ottowia caeni]
MNIDISIIIPAYNVEDYIGDALQSALSQEPPVSRIIVVDDGSSDRTREIVRNFKDPRIRYQYQNNQGLGPARNAGIELAGSDFIYFMDADDILLPGLTSSFKEALERHPGVDLFAFSAIDFEHKTGLKLPSSEYLQRKNGGIFKNGRSCLISSLEQENFPVCAFLYIFRRKVIDSKEPLRFQNIIHEDEPFTPALFMRSGTTIVTHHVYYRRRVRPNSIMTSPAGVRNVIGYLLTAQWWLRATQSHSSAEERLFVRQATFFYSLAIQISGRARVPISYTRSLVKEYIPELSRFAMLDAALSRLSRKLARYFISLHTRFLPTARHTKSV